MRQENSVAFNSALETLKEEFTIPNDQMATVAAGMGMVASALAILDSASLYWDDGANRKNQLIASILAESLNLSRQRPVRSTRPGGVEVERSGAQLCDECDRMVIVVGGR